MPQQQAPTDEEDGQDGGFETCGRGKVVKDQVIGTTEKQKPFSGRKSKPKACVCDWQQQNGGIKQHHQSQQSVQCQQQSQHKSVSEVAKGPNSKQQQSNSIKSTA